MNQSTHPKHRTPNYRLVTHINEWPDRFGRWHKSVYSVWQPVSLRATRKDLNASQPSP